MENVWLSLAEEEVENLLCLCAIGFLGWQILRIDCSRATSIVEGRGFEGVSSIQRWLIERNPIEIPEVVNFERVNFYTVNEPFSMANIASRISNRLFSKKISLKAESLKAFLWFNDD